MALGTGPNDEEGHIQIASYYILHNACGTQWLHTSMIYAFHFVIITEVEYYCFSIHIDARNNIVT